MSFTSRFVSTLFARLTQWFADATNGIKSFFAERVHTQELCTTRSDGTEVCASADQLAAILAGVSAGAPQQGRNEAPATAPASDRGDDADNSTTSTETSAASSTSDILSPSSTDAVAAGGGSDVAEAPEAATGGTSAREVGADTSTGSTPDDGATVPNGTPQSEAANDNAFPEEMSATGTD